MQKNIPKSTFPCGRINELRTGKIVMIGSSGIRSGIAKALVEGPVHLGFTGLEGDSHAESFHGGTEKAILQYDANHYAAWRDELPDIANRLVAGGFGENFVVSGMSESNMCIGDIVRAGSALLQISESRQPCFKLNHRFGHPQMARRTQFSGRTGWLYRVLNPGEVCQGDIIEVVERPLPEWTIARLQRYLYDEVSNLDAARTLSELELLSPGFRGLFKRRVENAVENWEARLSNGPLVTGAVAWMEAEVADIRTETENVKSFLLKLKDDAEPPHFEAGAHIDLQVNNSLTRSYSLCKIAGEGYLVAIQRSNLSRGGSSHMHDEVKVGDSILVTAPKNYFPLAHNAERHLFIAGGIGITPFLSMIEHLKKTKEDWELNYLVRHREDAAFADDLLIRYPARVRLHISGGQAAARLDLTQLLADPTNGTHLYCCGSHSLMEAARSASDGWPAGTVHFESFSPPAAQGIADCSPFLAKVNSTGLTLEIGEDKTLLAGLRDAGLVIPSSCETGTCGTCRVHYLSGKVDHRDMVLTSAERKLEMITCVSRAVDEVVLDL